MMGFREKVKRLLRRYFVTGFILLTPVVVTIFVLKMIFGFADSILGRFINNYIVIPITGYPIPFLGLIITLLLIFFTGFLATNFIGSKLLSWLESILLKIPFAKNVYLSTKQLIDMLFIHKKINTLKRVVIAEYPRKGVYTIGFLTNEGIMDINEKLEEETVGVFFPTTPNPTSGWLAMIPKKDVIPLDISIEDGIKLIISGGVLTPKGKNIRGKEDQSEVVREGL